MRRVRFLSGVVLLILVGGVAAFAVFQSAAMPALLPSIVAPSPGGAGARGPTPEPTVRPTPLGSAGLPSLPSDIGLACGLHVSYIVRSEPFFTLPNLSEYSQAVVTGRITAVSGGHWATSDDEPPANEYGSPPSASQVYHIIDVTITGVGKQPQHRQITAGSSIRVRVYGGTIGCHSFRFDIEPEFDVDDEVALFLGDVPGLAQAPREDFDLVDAWPIRDGVVSGGGIEISASELLEASTTQNP